MRLTMRDTIPQLFFYGYVGLNGYAVMKSSQTQARRRFNVANLNLAWLRAAIISHSRHARFMTP
jgi:hypothetical protein